ncbi:winged helix-turn-helix domain-containing protein [Chloroflexota bacterium]
MKVLVFEHEKQVIRDISFCLEVRYAGVDVIAVAKAQQGIDLVETESPDLVIVGSDLPDMPTLDIIKNIRDFSNVALIVLSEENTSLERAKELEMGADDYIIKPFSPIEFLARIRALLRRIQRDGFRPQSIVTIGSELTINFATREVFLAGKRLGLTPTEYHLLSELVRNEGRVLTHGTLLEKVWGSEYIDTPSFVKKYVHRLRSKIEPDANNPQMIVTERGVGYRFVKVI